MTRFLSLSLLIFALIFGAQSCSKNDVYEDVPTSINQFLSHYFPNSVLESFSSTSSGYVAIIKDGPGITFDKDNQWTSINGYGSPVPQVFLFDELPQTLYDYLEATENLDSVFIISRDSKQYKLQLLSSTLTYDIATGELTGAESSPS